MSSCNFNDALWLLMSSLRRICNVVDGSMACAAWWSSLLQQLYELSSESQLVSLVDVFEPNVCVSSKLGKSKRTSLSSEVLISMSSLSHYQLLLGSTLSFLLRRWIDCNGCCCCSMLASTSASASFLLSHEIKWRLRPPSEVNHRSQLGHCRADDMTRSSIMMDVILRTGWCVVECIIAMIHSEPCCSEMDLISRYSCCDQFE